MIDIPRTIHQIPQRQHNEDRLRRADSWLRRSEAAKDDTERFIFLWIAFNAAYGGETLPSDSDIQADERDKFSRFLREILERDDDGVLEKTLWRTQKILKRDDNGDLKTTCQRTYSDPIRALLDNHYIFDPFWKAVRGSDTGRDWKAKFSDSNRSAMKFMGRRNVHRVLVVLFKRLYTLRNQIVHGGATFEKGWGQDQVKDGSRIMESLVPSILEIMWTDIERNPESDVWGPVAYPRVNYGPR